MPRVSLAFFGAGVLCVLVGMGIGMWMGANQNFTLAPVHAHLNLLGFVALSIMGTFYALAGDRAPVRLAWVNLALSLGGVLIITPMLAQLLSGNTAIGPMMVIPEVILVAGMASFLAAIVIVWRRSGHAAAPATPATRMAAE
jgi:hypothetical protein